MIEFSIKDLFPNFILADKNGYAMAKAIEAGLKYMVSHVQTGLEVLQDVEKMPEWRLDEMAWELGCLYDYNANIEAKRRWIRDATPLAAALGTPQAIYNYLEGYFDEVELEEYWQYGGEPFHFRVTVSGKWTAESEAWARKAIAASQNVRSILDDFSVGSGTRIIIRGEGEVMARYWPRMTGPTTLTGTYPQTNITLKTTEAVSVIDTRATRGHVFPYPMAGTKPQANTVGAGEDVRISTEPEASGHIFPYGMPSENTKTGTSPQVNTVGANTDSTAATNSDGKAIAFSYPLCGDTPCGEGTL